VSRAARNRPPRRAFGVLLRAYPRRFRARYEADLLEAFEDAWHAEAEGATLPARLRFWLRQLRDAARGGAAAMLEPAAGPPGRRAHAGLASALAADARNALRALAKQPGFTALVVATLAVGIGANAAVFHALHAVVIRPLPYPESSRLVRLFEYYGTDPARSYVTAPSFLGWREHMRSLDRIAAVYTYRETGADYTDGEQPERLRTLRVSGGYLGVYGSAPFLGRELSREDERAGADVVLVSYDFWKTRLGGAGDVLGRRLTLDGQPHTVVGVAPRGFRDPLAGRVDAWLNLDLEKTRESTGNWYLTVVGRLAPGTAMALAREEAERVERSVERRLAGLEGHHAHLVPLQADVVGASGNALVLLMGAVGVVLLIACVNVAQLLMVRGLARERELAVRVALGCSRPRLVRQLLLESLLLALGGAVAGLVVARLGNELWLGLAAGSLPRAVDVGLDAALVAFAVAAAALTAAVFGLVPALRSSRPELARTLHESGRGHSAGPGRSSARRLLVAVQLALTFALTTAALLLGRSFERLGRVDLSVETGDVVSFEVSLPSGRYPEPAQRAAFHHRLAGLLEAVPGVRAAGAVSWLPAQGRYHTWGVALPGRGDGTFEGSPNGPADQRVVEGRFFEALGIPLLRGRLFRESDAADAPPVVVVSEQLVRELLPGEADPIGERLDVAGELREIVGVVADTAIDARGAVVPIVYHPHAQMADDRNWALVEVVASARGTGSLEDFAAVLRRLDPELVLYEPRELGPMLAQGIARERLLSYLLAAFAGVAFLLAGLGLYGVLSSSVGQRRREFGVRMAVGASAASVRALVVRQAAGVASAGVLAGLALSLWASRWLEAFVFETDPRDPGVLGMAALAFVALTLLATWFPAHRATRVAPSEVLRAE